MVTAAFIGPGTVTTCINAGFTSGYTLLWAMIFAIVATIILQEMVLRLTLKNQQTVDQQFISLSSHRYFKWMIGSLIIISILLGNSAYQAGNLTGAVLGVELIASGVTMNRSIILLVIVFITLFLVIQKTQKTLKNSLGLLVIGMSLAFVFAMFFSNFNLVPFLKGLFIPSVSKSEDWMSILSLVGTTVVPYNVFLYSFMVQDHFTGEADLGKAKKDLYFNVILGGIISISIIAVAAGVEGQQLTNVTDLALALEPIYGSWGKWLLGFGLFAAGLTSAVTAPLAAGLIAKSMFKDLGKYVFEVVSIAVIAIGFYFAYKAVKPLTLIMSAQFINGLLLPICTTLLVVLCFKTLGEHYKLSKIRGVIAISVLIITILLGLKSIL
jgi:manganese transport protein